MASFARAGVVIILAVTSLTFGARAAQGRLVWQMQSLVGYEGAKMIQSMTEGTHRSSSGIVTMLRGLAALFFGSTAVITELLEAPVVFPGAECAVSYVP